MWLLIREARVGRNKLKCLIWGVRESNVSSRFRIFIKEIVVRLV